MADDTPFAFSALPNTAQELESAAHRDELPVTGRTVLTVMGAVRGVGGIDSWGTDVEPPYRISGEEGGVPMEGTVTVSSVSATISKGQIREYVQVGISIEGTRLPGFLTSFYSIYGDGGSFYNGLDGTGVLLSDGTYVLSDSTIRQNPDEGFVMEGTVTVYQFDGDGGLVRTDGFDFSYGVV